MTHTEILQIDNGVYVSSHLNPNPCATTGRIWLDLCDQYLGDVGQMGATWIGLHAIVRDLARDPRLDAYERVCLLWTLDHAVVKRADYYRLAEDLRIFSERHPADPCHLDDWARIIGGCCSEHIALYGHPMAVKWFDASYNLTTGTKHFDVFEQFDSYAAEVSS